jgi:FKBP-type peptidyl-prolyl cis-trans isomerase
MKRLFPIFIVAAGLLALQVRAEDKPVEAKNATALNTQKEKASYSIGMDIGSGMKQQKLDIDPELVMKGFRDGFAGEKGLLTESEAKTVLEQFEKDLQARMAKEEMELPAKNKKEGETFLAENKRNDKEVKTLPSGLQYKVIREGEGESPKIDDTVTTQYRGTLIDGTEFDSSYSRGEPSTFALNQVIKGWQEALQLMKVGAKWRLFVPAELAYGEEGAGRTIQPNATLIFDIELLSIKKP